MPSKIAFVHYYMCNVCGEHYAARHEDESVHEDECPQCRCQDNVPMDIHGAPDAAF